MRRAAIIGAACRVVRRAGAEGLTLAAAAREAGVSKGGLLYHFPSKEALIAGMIEQLCADFDAGLERELAGEPAGGPGRWLRAYVRASFATGPADDDLSPALLAAVGANSELLTPLRAAFDRWQAHALADGLDPATATAIRLATDGLWLAELLGLSPPAPELRTQLRAALLALAPVTSDEATDRAAPPLPQAGVGDGG